MNIEELREYCLSKKAVSESFPFDEETLVFKVMDKIFLLVNINSKPLEFNIKCDPESAIELREQHSCVQPGYHMNKKHWNTIFIDGAVNSKIIQEWISDSYNLVIAGLAKAEQKRLKEM